MLVLTLKPRILQGAHNDRDGFSDLELREKVKLSVIEADSLGPNMLIIHIGTEFESLCL
jgi:hypothetical protein